MAETKSPPGPLQRLKGGMRRLLRRSGYDLVRVAPRDTRYAGASYDTSRPLPAGASEALRPDHPHLLDLRQRYRDCGAPMVPRAMWAPDYLKRELDLVHFRGDNPYVWQFRNVGALAKHKYYMYLRDLASRDAHGLLGKLGEDGLFGCWTFDYPGWPTVSRDLLDSVNELYFLDRHLQLLSRQDFNILDIGAGYGRMAHRVLAAAPGVSHYLCVDAVPESTFLCEYYTAFHSLQPRAEVIALDRLEQGLAGRRIDLAVNVHSFSEMTTPNIQGWLDWLVRLQVPWLFIVPNDADRLLTMEDDGRRGEFASLLQRAGYRQVVCEPVFADPTMREFINVTDHFFLFRREAA
ncbi:MAG TPA: putative sugar O-methyltransferase [Nevskiaceae bacterium]|nr:putative sugar O-methyltransferase [Nevskiaceae bacterium]